MSHFAGVAVIPSDFLPGIFVTNVQRVAVALGKANIPPLRQTETAYNQVT